MKPYNGQQLLHWVTVTMHVQMYTNLLALVELIINHTKIFIYSKYVLSVCVRTRACVRVCVCVCASWPQMTNNIHVLYIICLKPKWRGEPLGKWQKLRFHPKMFQSLLYIIINVSVWRFHPKALPNRLNPGDSPNVSLRHCMWYVFL